MQTLAQTLTEYRPVVDRLQERLHEERERRIARYGFAADCVCSRCGDTGTEPEPSVVDPEIYPICTCSAGDAKANQVARKAAWSYLVPARFAEYALESHPNTALAAEVCDWLAADPVRTGRNLVIQGKVGVGKTGAAIGAIRELHMAGMSVAYWSLPDLMDRFRAEESRAAKRATTAGQTPPLMDQLTRVSCLLLDDLGIERHTESGYVDERLFVLIDGRYVAGKPTILTTNLSKADLETSIGERAASRLRERYLAVRGKGGDLRRRADQEPTS